MYNNFEISLVVFMPSITKNHAVTFTNRSVRIFFNRIFSCCYAINCRAKIIAKQLSMATVPLFFEFFWCRVNVLQS